MAVKSHRKGHTTIHTYEVVDPHIDLNQTAERRYLPDGVASVSFGLDNTRLGRLRSANPRKSLGVKSPESDVIVSASSSEFQGDFTNIFQDTYNQTDYEDANTDGDKITISEIGLWNGVAFNSDMEGGLIAAEGATGIPVFYGYIDTFTTPDKLTFVNTVASVLDTGASATDGYDLSILYQKTYDKRGIWLSDGQRVFLVQNETITKYLDIGITAAIGTKWFGTRISSSLFMFVNPKYPPRVIKLNKAAVQDFPAVRFVGKATTASVAADHTALVNHTTEMTDGDDTTAFSSIAGTTPLSIVFDSGVSTIANGDTITIRISTETDTTNWKLYAYTDTNSVTASDAVAVANSTVSGVHDHTITLTTAFIAQLGDLGGGAWAVRFGPDSTNTAPAVNVTANLTAITLQDDKTTYAGILPLDNGLDKIGYQLTMVAAAGGSLAAGDYRVRMRQIDSTSGNSVSKIADVAATETLVSEVFKVTAVDSDKITITINGGSAPFVPNCPRATHYEVYRTEADGSTYYLEKTVQVIRAIDDLNTTIVLDMDDADLVFKDVLPTIALNHGGLPPIGKKIASIAGVTLIAGAADTAHVDPTFNATSSTTPTIDWPIVEDDETLYVSALDAVQPESFNPADKRRLSRRGDVFQNFAVAGDVALAVMKEGVHRVSVSGTTLNIVTVGESGVGTPWSESVIAVGDMAIWATPHGMRIYNTKFDRDTGGLEYLFGKGGDNLQAWLEEAFQDGDTVFCGYDDRDDILRVRRVAPFSTPFSAGAAEDILEFTAGTKNGLAFLLKSVTNTSLGLYIAMDFVPDDGDTFKVVTRSNVKDDLALGFAVSTTSITSWDGTPYSGVSVNDVIHFTSGTNVGVARVISAVTGTKISWVSALAAAPIDADTFDTILETVIVTKTIGGTTSKAVVPDLVEHLSGPQGTPSSPTADDDTINDQTTCMTDGTLTGVCFNIQKDADPSGYNSAKATFNSGLSTLASGDTITLRIGNFGGGAADIHMYAYTDADSVTSSNEIILNSAGADADLVYTLTTAFIAQLGDLGSGKFAVRITHAGATSNRSSATELTTSLTVLDISGTTTTVTANNSTPFGSVNVGDAIHWTSGNNNDLIRYLSAATSSVLTWTTVLPNVPADGESFNILNSAALSDTVDLWTLTTTGITAPRGTPFTSVAADDYLIINDGDNANEARKIATASNTVLTWTDALDQASAAGDTIDVANDTTTAFTDTIDEVEMTLTAKSIAVPDGTSIAAQYSFKTKTWTQFDNDVGTCYAASTFAGTSVLAVPALYTQTREGAIFELNSKAASHPYDDYVLQEVLSTGYTLSGRTITIDTPGSTRQWITSMIGDSIRFISTNTDINGQVRRIADLATGPIGATIDKGAFTSATSDSGGSFTDITTATTDLNTDVIAMTLENPDSGADDTGTRIKFEKGLASLGTSDTIRVYAKDIVGTSPVLTASPYSSATVITAGDAITTNLDSGDGWYTLTLTQAFIDDLFDQGSDAWWVRLTISEADTFSLTEIDCTQCPHVLTYTPGLNGLATTDTYVIGSNHFRLRMAPQLGLDFGNVKTLLGLSVHALAGSRHANNTAYASPPTTDLDVRAYRDFHDTAISEKLDDISIGSTEGDTLIDEDRHSAVECQGNAIELEIESVDARTDFVITHLSADIVEDGVEDADTSTTSGAS